MKIYNYAKFPEGFDYNYGDICDFDTWDLERLKDFDEVYYWYATGSYEGSGHLIGLLKGKWYMHDCGHCSCYGPLGHFDYLKSNKYSWEEIESLYQKDLNGKEIMADEWDAGALNGLWSAYAKARPEETVAFPKEKNVKTKEKL